MRISTAKLLHGVLAVAPCQDARPADARPVFVWLDDPNVWLTDVCLQQFFRSINLLPGINGVGVQSIWRFTAALPIFESEMVRDGWMCSRILLLFLGHDPKIPDPFPLFGGEFRIDAFRILMGNDVRKSVSSEHVFSFTPISWRFRDTPM